jgi:uncharacterized membrane protein YbhN (UPF0104 family)
VRDADVAVESGGERTPRARHLRLALNHAKGNLRHRALELAGFLVVTYAVLKLIPAFEEALHALEHASWQWVVALLAIEVLSEAGFVLAWGRVVDPEDTLATGPGAGRMDQHVAWMQLGGGLVLPGGSWGGMGAGGVILHRFGMPNKLIAERQFTLSFLNTGIDALALVVFGLGLASGILSGEENLLLTLLPAAVAGAAIVAAVLGARRLAAVAERVRARHAKTATVAETLSVAVEDTKRLVQRGAWTPILGAVAYLTLEVTVLWLSFHAVHASPVPGFPIVVMAYVIGALGGSLPLPASAGTIGGVAGMLIVYGVAHDAALPAVLLHQAIGLLVPVIGGAIAYTIIRRRVGPMQVGDADEPAAPPSGSHER